MIVRW
ncbi:hypothetical protein EE612_043106 [Oryza sativa]